MDQSGQVEASPVHTDQIQEAVAWQIATAAGLVQEEGLEKVAEHIGKV